MVIWWACSRGGYGLAALMALAIVTLLLGLWIQAGVFATVGMHVAIEETLEDSLCAELVDEERHGMAFGVLAAVNGIGGFLSIQGGCPNTPGGV